MSSTETPRDKTHLDDDLATAVEYLLGRDRRDVVELLLAADRENITYVRVGTDWGWDYYNLSVYVHLDLLDEFTDDRVAALDEGMRLATRGRGYEFGSTLVYLAPIRTHGDWQAYVKSSLTRHPVNQASLAPLPEQHPVADRMSFRDQSELRVYEASKRAQARLPKHEDVTIIPNCAARVPDYTWEPDFVVLYRGRCIAVEVDGASHRKRWASDKSRDDILTDSGLQRVTRIAVEDTEDDDTLDGFVNAALQRMTV